MRHLLLPMLIILAAACAPAAWAEANAEPPHIAVLRLEDVLVNFKMYVSGKEELQQDKAKFQAKLDEYEAKLKDLDDKLHLLNPTSDSWFQLHMDFETTKVEEKEVAERGNQSLPARHAELIKACYATIHSTLQSFCQDHGIKLVHLAPNPVLQGSDSHDINEQLFTQSVLYFDSSLDITDAFIPYLNDHWAASKAASPPSSPGPGAAPAPSPAPAPSLVPAAANPPAAAVPVPGK
jgi:Skp family chaperone for outer membrane proteins